MRVDIKEGATGAWRFVTGGLRLMASRMITGLFLAPLLLVSSCGTEGGGINDDPDAGTAQDQFNTLMKRPSYEEVTERYKKMMGGVRAVTVEIGGISEWRQPEGGTPVNGAACGFDFPDVGDDGGTRQISGGVSEGAIPDGRWPQVVERVAQVVQKYGFDSHEMMQDKRGLHRVRFTDSYGGDFMLGTEANTSMSISSGCFLLEEARERGAPTETE